MEDKLLWTPGTVALWNDRKFIEKRIAEQFSYITELYQKRRNELTEERTEELGGCAHVILYNFMKRLKELNIVA